MKVIFKDKDLEYYYITPLDNITGKHPVSKEVIKQFKKKVFILLSIESIEDLKEFRSLKFEALKGKMKGFYSIRLNIQYRLIFTLGKDVNELKIAIVNIIEISKHYQ